MNHVVRAYAIEDISVGDTASFEKTFTEKDVLAFSELSGDINPLHLNEAYAETTIFKKRLVHGMLAGSLCSTLVGVYLPGKRCLYLQQTLSFKKPIYIGETITVTGVVESVSFSTKVLHIYVSMKRGNEEVLSGVAIAQVL